MFTHFPVEISKIFQYVFNAQRQIIEKLRINGENTISSKSIFVILRNSENNDS